MKIAVCSDEKYPVHETIIEELKKQGHEVILFGALKSGHEESWAKVACEAAESIKQGACNEGIFLCWSGTGISMAANKVPGIRAALCTDVETVKDARIWNHANVLALSNRLLKSNMVYDILKAWFETPLNTKGEAGVKDLNELDQNFRKK